MDISRAVSALKRCGPMTFMEVCGTHTSAIARSGLSRLLPENIRLVSGPGCPVCVTEVGVTDSVIEYSCMTDSVILSFGDLFRVRGSSRSLIEASADGVRLQIVYSPLDAVTLATQYPDKNYLLAAVGFETTAPLYSLVLDSIIRENIRNLKLCPSLKTIVPAMNFIARQGTVDGFICPGHVAAIIGSDAFNPLKTHGFPMVIAGFEPRDILLAIVKLAALRTQNRPQVVNLYGSVVRKEGNQKARRQIDKYFHIADGFWRGIGKIESSALVPRDEYSEYFVEAKQTSSANAPGCRCSDVLLGRISPRECPLFGKLCKPESPVGACMVSREGACSVWFGVLKDEN